MAIVAQLIALVVGAIVAFRTGDPSLARRRALAGAVIALIAALIERLIIGGTASSLAVVTTLIAVLAISMTPVVATSGRTFARISMIIAVALLFSRSQSPSIMCGLWAASAALVWWELHERGHVQCARLFLFHHIPSFLFFALGTALLARGSAEYAAVFISVAIVIREALLPLHGWFPKFVSRAPMGVVVAFVGPQLGIYAHLTLFPNGPTGLTMTLAALGAFTAVIAAALGLVQSEGKRALAFLLMSQTGLVTFGLESHSGVAHQGALLSWQVLALSASGFALVLAALGARGSRLSIVRPSGHFDSTPRMAVAFLLLGFASVGLPLTLGFVSEDLLVQGAVAEFPILALTLVVATALNGMSVMRCFFALFTGSRRSVGLRDLNRREWVAVSLLLAVLLTGGIVPRLFVSDAKELHSSLEMGAPPFRSKFVQRAHEVTEALGQIVLKPDQWRHDASSKALVREQPALGRRNAQKGSGVL